MKYLLLFSPPPSAGLISNPVRFVIGSGVVCLGKKTSRQIVDPHQYSAIRRTTHDRFTATLQNSCRWANLVMDEATFLSSDLWFSNACKLHARGRNIDKDTLRSHIRVRTQILRSGIISGILYLCSFEVIIIIFRNFGKIFLVTIFLKYLTLQFWIELYIAIMIFIY